MHKLLKKHFNGNFGKFLKQFLEELKKNCAGTSENFGDKLQRKLEKILEIFGAVFWLRAQSKDVVNVVKNFRETAVASKKNVWPYVDGLYTRKCGTSVTSSDVKIGKFFLSITIDTFWFLSIIIDIKLGKDNESGD